MNSKKEWSSVDLSMMEMALSEAEKATSHHDVPVGAVILENSTGKILAVAHNTREQEGSALGHAEVSAIQQACQKTGTWRLSDCTLYVTLEPCPMCAGAIIAARIPRVVCGAKDAVAGALGSVWSLHTHPIQNTHTTVEFGCMEHSAQVQLKSFFQRKR